MIPDPNDPFGRRRKGKKKDDDKDAPFNPEPEQPSMPDEPDNVVGSRPPKRRGLRPAEAEDDEEEDEES